MDVSHFHLLRRNSPLAPLQINFFPLGLTDLPRSAKDQDGKFQRAPHHIVGIGVDLPRKNSYFFRIDNCGVMFFLAGL